MIIGAARRSWGPGENLTLTDAELQACRPIAGEDGTALRAFCPFHGSDKQRSLRVNIETGHFKCFACDAWGYLDSARHSRRAASFGNSTLGKRKYQQVGSRSTNSKPTVRPAIAPKPEPEARPELAELMERYRAALPGSPGEAYLLERRIPLDVAQAAGVGYSPPGQWAHRNAAGRPVRDWHRGRLVFPHTNPAGDVVNLYGRAVGDAPKSERHDHLAGAKGYFHAQALRDGSGPVTVCEGAFDALALMAAGAPRVVAIFGVTGWRWEWAKGARELIFALDADETGAEHLRELAREARLRGRAVAYVEPSSYGGEKDASAAWRAGVLTLGDWSDALKPDEPAPKASTLEAPASPQEREAAAPEPVPPMCWSDALKACETALDVRDKQALYELSYEYLEEGAGFLAELEADLRRDVAQLEAGDALPETLAGQLFTWRIADYTLRNRARRAQDAPGAAGDVVERLHPQVRRDGGSLVVSGLDMATRHALLSRLAGDERKPLRMVPARQDYKGGSIGFSPADAATGDALALLMSRELRRLDTLRSKEVLPHGDDNR